METPGTLLVLAADYRRRTSPRVPRTRTKGNSMMFAKKFLVFAAVCATPFGARGQDVDILVFSSEDSGGALVAAEYDFSEKVLVRDRLGFCPGGICLYSSTDPGFRSSSGSRPAESLYALDPGTPVILEVTELAPGASLKFGPDVLDEVGESTTIGTALALHVHPEYQLQAPEGVVGDFGVSFRLTTSAPQYSSSDVVALVLTNGDAPATPTPPNATPTATATPTTAISDCEGDCNGDGVVDVTEILTAVNIALGGASADTCQAADTSHDGMVSVDEIIRTVSAALNGC